MVRQPDSVFTIGLRGIDESLAHSRFSELVPIGSFLAPDATRRPGNRREAFGADRGFAVNAGSKAAVAIPPQCGVHLAQQSGLAVHVSNRQIPFRRLLNLI